MLTVIDADRRIFNCYTVCRYAECHHAECCGAL
jgi:hypothetical protein